MERRDQAEESFFYRGFFYGFSEPQPCSIACLATGYFLVESEHRTTLTRVTSDPGRIPEYYRMCRDILCNHRAGADKRVLANCVAANNSCVSTYARSSFNERAHIVFRSIAREVRARRAHVCEHHTRTAEDVILKLDAFIYRDVVLNLNIVATAHPG